MEQALPVVILCGGKGTRLREQTEHLPKPLVEIGGMPILWHVMKIYAAQGFCRFILALGYLGHRIREYFQGQGEGWEIRFVDTGLETPTGGRLWRLRPYLEGRFLATYADGLADIDLHALLRFHEARGGVATLTVVHPLSPFGLVDVEEDGRITRFREKPRMEEWVNGGFFVFEPGLFDYLEPESTLEREPFERMAQEGRIYAYRHEGFWACMDTFKDVEHLNALWEQGKAPWKRW